MSCTSLSICTRSERVVSRSALNGEEDVSVGEQLKVERDATHNNCSRFDACSYACAKRQSEKTATGAWHQER